MHIKVTKSKSIAVMSVSLIILLCLYAGGRIWRFANKEMAQNEARITLEKIKSAEVEFKSKNGRFGTLSELAKDGFIASGLVQESNEKYKYSITITDSGYLSIAEPLNQGDTGLQTYKIEYP